VAAIRRDEEANLERVGLLVVMGSPFGPTPEAAMFQRSFTFWRCRGAVFLRAFLLGLLLIPLGAAAASLHLHDEIQTHLTLSGTSVTMTGRSELHITGRDTDPMPGTQIQLNSPDAWLFLRHVRPSVVNSSFLGRIRVNGALAANNQNVRVVQHGMGTVVIPHAPGQVVLEVFRGRHFQDGPLTFSAPQMVEGLPAGRTPWNNAISSFRLKRGYMVTFADNADGGGFSRVYVAQDGDLEVAILPEDLENKIEFIRVLPWRWVSKKGYAGGVETAGGEPDGVRASWFYTWSASRNSSLNIEYVPTQQTSVWPGLSESRNKANVTHYLGYNEPNNPVEDAHKYTPTPQSAVNHWPNLMRAGFRLGSPSPTDGGLNWLYEFVDLADAANLRVDYAVVHFYRCGQTATNLYNFLRDIHLRTGRPIWLKEFNNGANWTTCAVPTLEQNAQRIKEWIDMMDVTPWVERYSIYSWVQEPRQVYLNGQLTPMGVVYRDQDSPIGYRQEVPAGQGHEAHYEFTGNVRDRSEFANHAMWVGAPRYVPAPAGNAAVFDGKHDWLQLPPNVGGGQDFSFAAWINWDGGSNWQRIFDFGNGDTTEGRQLGRYLFLTPRSGAGTLRFALRIDGSEQLLNGPALVPGEWTHVAVTIGRSNTARLYVNGEIVASGPVTGRPAGVGARFSYLGKSQFRSDPLFAGRMADVRILGHELAPGEIAELATLPSAGATYQQWAATIPFPDGQGGLYDDPDGDGVPNVLEYLLGGDPLAAGSATLPVPTLKNGAALGPAADAARSYLSLRVRVRRDPGGIDLVPQAASSLEGLSLPGASENIRQSGLPEGDGDFDIYTYYFTLPIDESPTGKGFMRLHVSGE
jgi:hypothetical protein